MADDHCPVTNNLILLKEYVEKSLYFKNSNPDLDIYELIVKLIRILKDKHSSKILFAIKKLGYSNKYAIKKFCNLNNGDIIKQIGNLESYGIINELRKSDSDYKILVPFWKNISRTGTRNITFYSVDESFLHLVDAFEGEVSKYFHPAIVLKLIKRGKQWRDHKETVLKQNKIREQEIKNSLGACHRCGRLIPKTATKNDYLQLTETRVLCAHCNRISTAEEKFKWCSQT